MLEIEPIFGVNKLSEKDIKVIYRLLEYGARLTGELKNPREIPDKIMSMVTPGRFTKNANS